MLEVSRIEFSTTDNFKRFFAKVRDLYTANGAYHPSMIMNLDETFLELAIAKAKVLVAANKKWGVRAEADTSQHITAVVTIAADGSYLPVLIILPLAKLPPDVDQSKYPMFEWAFQTNGWINCGIFEKYCRETVIPELKRRRAVLEKQGIMNARGLLYVDGHSSRNNQELMEEFAANGIDVQCFVAHTSHIAQPLDRVVYSVFKRFFREQLNITAHMTAADMRRTVLTAADIGFQKSLLRCYIETAFRKAGLYPLDENQILSHEAVSISPPESTSPPTPETPAKGGPPSVSCATLTAPEVRPTLINKEDRAKKTASRAKKTTSAPPTPIVAKITVKQTSSQQNPKKRASPVPKTVQKVVERSKTRKCDSCDRTSSSTDNWASCNDCQFDVCFACNSETTIFSEHMEEEHPGQRAPKRLCTVASYAQYDMSDDDYEEV